jgi:hypothetical protein
MHQRVWISACAALAVALSATFAAQSTGCVQKADAPVGTTGAAGASDAIKFILTNVMPASSAPPAGAAGAAGAATTGTSGSSSASKPASTYRLDADESKLSAHVGHKVTITGTAEPASASSSSPSAAPPAAGGSSSSSANAPRLKVDSVTMVAATCP